MLQHLAEVAADLSRYPILSSANTLALGNEYWGEVLPCEAAALRTPYVSILFRPSLTPRVTAPFAAAGGFGKLLRRPGIAWSQPPLALGYSQLVAVAAMAEHVEASRKP